MWPVHLFWVNVFRRDNSPARRETSVAFTGRSFSPREAEQAVDFSPKKSSWEFSPIKKPFFPRKTGVSLYCFSGWFRDVFFKKVFGKTRMSFQPSQQEREKI
jgi:hypothetical protein